jgi:hypothetical protein
LLCRVGQVFEETALPLGHGISGDVPTVAVINKTDITPAGMQGVPARRLTMP